MYPNKAQIAEIARLFHEGDPMFDNRAEVRFYVGALRHSASSENGFIEPAVLRMIADYMERECLEREPGRPTDGAFYKGGQAWIWQRIDWRLAHWARVFDKLYRRPKYRELTRGWSDEFRKKIARGKALDRVEHETGIKRNTLRSYADWRERYGILAWQERTVAPPPLRNRPQPSAEDQALIDQLTEDYVRR
jgi:hypothetical protein